jgi:NAD(P)H-hydrate epimerase
MTAPKDATPRLTAEVPPLPPRPPDMHKGQAGRVAIVAGSRGMSGAAVLCAQGALRGGAGLVRVYCPASVQPIIAAAEPCLMTVGVGEDAEGRVAYGPAAQKLDLEWANVLVIGPGLGQSLALPEFVSYAVRHFPGPVVVDADGLNNLATIAKVGDRLWKSRAGRDTVITPHPGEMARLRAGAEMPPGDGHDDATRVASACEYARYAGVTVVLKGHRTVVSTPTDAFINTTGNPGMATGGMGDVLTGLIAALLAQGMPGFDAARLAVHAHGLAADRCRREIGEVGYLARDVADGLPAALAEASRPRIGFV